jgi:hypothetical protein
MNTEFEEARIYIEECIIDELHNFFDYKGIDKELYNEAVSCFAAQMIYNEEYNKIYFYYELDPESRYSIDPELLYRRINSRLLETVYEFLHVWIEILGPAINWYEDKRISKVVDMSVKYLRPTCFTWWNCFDGTKRFIEDGHIVRIDIDRYRMLHSDDLGPKQINSEDSDNTGLSSFSSQVNELNLKYDFEGNNKEDVEKGFNEYAKIYKSYFGKDLKPINDKDIKYIYLDIYRVEEEDTTLLALSNEDTTE